MDLNPIQVGYFITQVGLSAASFGVASSDVTAVGQALTKLFDYRCSAPAAIVPGAPAETQAICMNPACPLADNATCSAYGTPVMPQLAANATTSSGGSAGASPGSSTSSGSPAAVQTTSGASRIVQDVMGYMLAAFAVVLIL